MNWTGGSLQRTKTANKGIIQKQKAFFARARAHLQNGFTLPIVPFEPSYLQNHNDYELTGRPPFYGAGLVRHPGHSDHSVRRRYQPIQPEISSKPSCGRASGTRQNDANGQRGKRNAGNADVETQLLEANKKRLLGQHDWIGVTPSKPLSLSFLSSKEKTKVGRRRKVEGKHSATARRREHANFVTQGLRPTDDQHTGVLASGAIRHHSSDIVIRIGTDALTTTACSTGLSGDTQSHASSDPMLFDQPTRDTELPDVHEAAQLTTTGVYPHEQRFAQKSNAAKRTWVDEPAQRCPRPHCRLEADSFREQAESHSPRGKKPTSSSASFLTSNVLASEATTSGLCIIQHVEGIQQSLRLVFEDSNSSVDACDRNAIHDQSNDGTNYALRVADAGDSQTGFMHHVCAELELRSESEASDAVAIVDDKPWKSLLNVADESSSHTTTLNNSGKSITHPHPTTAQCFEAKRTSWSQRATQGEQTYASSSVISASLPSLKQDVQMRTFTHGMSTGVNRQNETTLRVLDADERFWQKFVFDSDEESSLETVYECQVNNKPRAGRLPLPVAVRSVSSTPFRPISGRGPCITDGIHDTAKFAPHSGFREISSPAARPACFVEELSDGKQGDNTAEPSAFGEQSVTHTSLVNNASCDTDLISSRVSSHTETSRRGLEHPGCRGDCLLERAQASSCETITMSEFENWNPVVPNWGETAQRV